MYQDLLQTGSRRRFFGLAESAVLTLGLVLIGCAHSQRDALQVQLEEVIATAFAAHQSGGVVLVARDGRSVFRRAYGMADVELAVPMRPDHILGTGSITKQFTAVSILQLVSQGLIKLEDDVRGYVPHMDTGDRALNIEQVLTHTSGLPNFVDREDFVTISRIDQSIDELLALTRGMPLRFEPGTGFYYSDTGYILLGAIIERVTGLSYPEYLEQKLFRPLGMMDTWYGDDARLIPRRAKGYSVRDGRLVHAAHLSMTVPHAAGAVFSTVDDLLRWEKALRGGAVVPESLLRRAWTPRELPDGTPSGYGYGWKLCTLAGRATVEHGGFVNGFQANALWLPDEHLTVIVMVNNDSDAPDAGALARRIARFVLTGSPELRLHTMTPEERKALVGRYQDATRVVREISDRAGIMHVQRENAAARPLVAISPKELTATDGDGALLLTFLFGAQGRAEVVRAALRCEPVYTASRLSEETR